MTSEHEIMYEFKGRIMKELSRRLTKKVSINIFYKEAEDFIGIILSTPDAKEDNSRLYKIDDPWTMITTNTPIGNICEKIVEQYKAFILLKYFKRDRYEEK